MAKVKMKDVVGALQSIRDWTNGALSELIAYQDKLRSAGDPPIPELDYAVSTVSAAYQATIDAVTDATSAEKAIGDVNMVNDNQQTLNLSSGVGRNC